MIGGKPERECAAEAMSDDYWMIEAPVASVWRVFTDLPGRRQWLSTVTRVEMLTTGPFGAGTVWRETRS